MRAIPSRPLTAQVQASGSGVPNGRWRWFALYPGLLLVSQLWTATRPPQELSAPAGSERVSLGSGTSALSALRWPALVHDETKLPIVLLHGSPGDAANFSALARRLADDGRVVLAPDLPGFGGSVDVAGSRSIEAHARAVLAALDAREFHVAAWSMGGGVALHMAQLAPQRVRSLSLIASIGVQEAEGSGNHAFEHVKYAAMWLLCVPGAELIPHFGLFGSRGERSGFCRNFLESDQRPLRAILSESKTPMLIAQGRKDFLVPAWCAQSSHELAANSRLVMFQGSHFLLFPPPGQLDQLEPELEAFLARHDELGRTEPHVTLDLSQSQLDPTPEPFWLPRKIPWWIAFVGCVLLARFRAGACGLFVGGLAAMLQLDLGLGLCAGFVGACWRALSGGGRSWKRWGLEVTRFLGGVIFGACFAISAGKQLCELAGAIGGTLLTLAVPILAVELLARVRQLRRARAAA